MAAAAVDQHEGSRLTRTLTWRGGFALALVIPMSGLAAAAPSTAAEDMKG